MSREIARSENTISKKRYRDNNDQSPVPARKSRKLSDEASPASEGKYVDVDASPRLPNKHTKKERKQNRSTRIHSLRKQLARGSLPSTIQQEKEREVAALLHEQDKTTSQKQAKKTLERYHYVRFLERRKAEKRLKQLRKQQARKGDSAEIEAKIYEMEVNRNYAIYAPLGQKYVSIFVAEAGNGQQDDDDQLANTKQPSKPAMWYTVETTMLQGEAALEALKDSKTIPPAQNADLNGDGADQRDKKKDRGRTEDKNSSHTKSSRNHQRQKASQALDEEVEGSSEDDTMDGGFFER